MALKTSDGTVLNQTSFTSGAVTSETTTTYTLTEDIYEDFDLPGTENRGTRLKWTTGMQISQKDLDNAFAADTVASITPDTGGAAGGTQVVITGTNLEDTTGVTFGGTAGTGVDIANPEEVRVTTPAHAAGAVDVVVQNDRGNVTLTGGFTYT